MHDFYEIAETVSIEEILQKYPIAADFFENMNLGELDQKKPLADALEMADQDWIAELGTDVDDVLEQFADFMVALSSPEDDVFRIGSITIVGGTYKDGSPEDVELTVRTGEVLSIVGPTGSGKSRLLGDIECIAQ